MGFPHGLGHSGATKDCLEGCHTFQPTLGAAGCAQHSVSVSSVFLQAMREIVFEFLFL